MNEAQVSEFHPASIGMVRCDRCARTVDIMRTAPHGEGERKHKVLACAIDRAAIVTDRWRWCDEYRPKKK